METKPDDAGALPKSPQAERLVPIGHKCDRVSPAKLVQPGNSARLNDLHQNGCPLEPTIVLRGMVGPSQSRSCWFFTLIERALVEGGQGGGASQPPGSDAYGTSVLPAHRTVRDLPD